MGDNLKRAFTEEQKNQILEYFYKGLSSRKICKKLGWDVTRKSTVNDFLKPFRDLIDTDKDIGLRPLYPKERKSLNGVQVNNLPKILFWDLESSLIEGMFFRLWKENIPFNRVTKQSHLLSHSYAFNDGEVIGSRLTPEQVKTGDDFGLVVKMIEAINQADLIVTFNGKKFDTKLLNTRALYWGLPPINYPKHIDLFEQAKRVFKFPSNSMQSVSKYLGLDGKIQTGGTLLWERCADWSNYQQCNNALEELMIYGNQDIEATRDLYKRLQGWMKGIPNLATITNVVSETSSLRCVHCGAEDVFKVDQKTYTPTSSFALYRCNNNECRGLSRVTSNGKNLVGVI